MAKKIVDESTKEIKAKLQDGKVVLGAKQVHSGIVKGTITKVYVAQNCPKDLKQDLVHYTAVAQVPFVELELNNEELGVLCKKNFFVSVLGIVGE